MFYVKTNTLIKLSGRSRQNLHGARRDKRLPSEELENGDHIYDVDNEKVRTLIKNTPTTMGEAKVRQTSAFVKEFQRQRVNQELACIKTGQFDYMASADPEDEAPLNKSLDDSALDRRKKEVEIEYKESQVEKINVALEALTGDLINRQVVRSYMEKYLGTFNQQVLDFPSTGFVSELYDLFKREDDGMKAIRDGEKRFEKKMSALLKDTMHAMRENQL